MYASINVESAWTLFDAQLGVIAPVKFRVAGSEAILCEACMVEIHSVNIDGADPAERPSAVPEHSGCRVEHHL